LDGIIVPFASKQIEIRRPLAGRWVLLEGTMSQSKENDTTPADGKARVPGWALRSA
jgi:hypothetical protein